MRLSLPADPGWLELAAAAAVAVVVAVVAVVAASATAAADAGRLTRVYLIALDTSWSTTNVIHFSSVSTMEVGHGTQHLGRWNT